MSSGPGQAANSLRAWARWWHRRTTKDMVERITRVADRIDQALAVPPEARDRRKLEKARAWARDAADRYAAFDRVQGAVETAEALDRAAFCIGELLAEGTDRGDRTDRT